MTHAKLKNLCGMLFVTIVLAGCATQPRTFSNESPLASFDNYRTYTFASSAGTDDRKGIRSLLSQYLINEISLQMDQRGYSYVEDTADLKFDFAFITREKIRSTSSPSFGGYYGYGGYPGYGYYGGYGNEYRISQFTEGTLSIAAIDTATQGVAWEGGSIATITDEVRDNMGLAIKGAVEQIFTRFSYSVPGSSPPSSSTETL